MPGDKAGTATDVVRVGLAGANSMPRMQARVVCYPQLGDALVGQVDYYTTFYDPGSNQFSYQIDQTAVDSFGADFVPNIAEVFSEVHDGADQIPGGTNFHEQFADTHIWFPAGAAAAGTTNWQPYGGSGATATPKRDLGYGQQMVGTGQFAAAGSTPQLDVWDSNCAA